MLYIAKNAYVFGFNYTTSESETSNNFLLTTDSKTLALQIGKYINETFRLTFQYQRSESDFKSGSTGLLTSSDSDRYQLEAKKLFTLASGKTVNLIASFSYGETTRPSDIKDNRFSLGADYYLSNTASIGASASLVTADNLFQEGKNLGLNTRVFITPSFSVYVGISRFFANDNLVSDSDTIEAALTARF